MTRKDQNGECQQGQYITSLASVIAKLRHPTQGCPWDLEQTHETLLPYLFEEAYEFKDALVRKNSQDMKDELGDLLLQVLLHAQLASERGDFNFADVCQNLESKMIERHPHVFGELLEKGLSKEEIEQQWKEIKKKSQKNVKTSLMPHKLLFASAMDSAQRIGEKSQKLQFDWNSPQEVWSKVHEELNELEEANEHDQREELGDLFFTLVQWARHQGWSGEEVLEDSNRKFLKRFHRMEELALAQGAKWEDLSLQEKEDLWARVKKEK